MVHNGRVLSLSLAATVTAATLVAGIVLYATAVSEAVLQRGLDAGGHPGLLVATYTQTDAGPAALTSSELERADAALRGFAGQTVRLPLLQTVSFGQTAPLQLAMIDAAGQPALFEPSPSAVVAFREDVERWVELDDGKLPADPTPSGTDTGVLIRSDVAATYGIRVGDRFTLASARAFRVQPVRVVISGIVRPLDEHAAYWTAVPEPHGSPLVFVTTRSLFLRDVQPKTPLPPEASGFGWSLLYDSTALHASNEHAVHDGLLATAARLDQLLPRIALDSAPLAPLEAFEAQESSLTSLLLALAVPTTVILAYFIAVAAGMAMARDRIEIATLHDRGASRGQIAASYLLQSAIFGLVAIAAGPPLGLLLAGFMGATASFLVFDAGALLPVTLGPRAYLAAVGAALLALAATLAPAWEAGGASIVRRRQEAGRQLRPALVQRLWLDVALVPVAWYAYDVLKRHGAVVTVGPGGGLEIDPLLFLVPALFVLVATMLALRLVPWLLRGGAALCARPPWLIAPLALRYASRQPGMAGRLMLALAITVAMGAYSASVAHTLERNQFDQALYRNGAPLQVDESGPRDPKTQTVIAPPFDLHLPLPRVGGATQVARWTGQVQALPGVNVRLLAIDPVTFWTVASYRPSFAALPARDLEGLLRADDQAALVGGDFLARDHLHMDDRFTVQQGSRSIEFRVAGVVDAFPTLYAADGPFAVVNLRYAWGVLGEGPSEAWLAAGDAADVAGIVTSLRQRGFTVDGVHDSRDDVRRLRAGPAWRGLAGILTAGFLIGALLAVAGFAVHVVLSLDQRRVQLGVLRAVGATVGQLAALFCTELTVLVVTGFATGAVVGVGTSFVFTPFLRVVDLTDPHAGIPPFVIVVATGDLVTLAIVVLGLLLPALGGCVIAMRRMRLYEVLRLGEDAA